MKKQLEHLYKYLLNNLITYNDLAEYLRFTALAGRICYSSDDVSLIINEDKRVNENVIDYLRKLSLRNHTSIFCHNVVLKDLSQYDTFYALEELIGIDDNVKYLLEFLDAYQTFPVIDEPSHVDRIKKAYYALLKMVLRYYLKGIPYTPNSSDLTINFRTILETAKLLGYEQELWDNLSKVEIPPIKILATVKTSTGSKVHILRHQVVDKGEVLTFILEGVSRVLTHQLVRHKLDVEYSQRSHRYVKIRQNEDASAVFVIPEFPYLDDEDLRRQVKDLIEIEYVNELQVYKNLCDQVRAEDARYVIGDGIRTVIMATMYSKETIDNFLQLRTDQHAQWEIREIAEILGSIRDVSKE